MLYSQMYFNLFLFQSQQQHTQSALQQMAGSSLVQQAQVHVVQQHAGGEDVSIKSEAAGQATATLVANADGTLTTVTGGQPTVQFTTVPTATATNVSGQQIQYVIQLPASAATASNGQPFQIQMLPQQFQVSEEEELRRMLISLFTIIYYQNLHSLSRSVSWVTFAK